MVPTMCNGRERNVLTEKNNGGNHVKEVLQSWWPSKQNEVMEALNKLKTVRLLGRIRFRSNGSEQQYQSIHRILIRRWENEEFSCGICVSWWHVLMTFPVKWCFAAVDRAFYELSYQLRVNVCVITVRFVDWIPTTVMNFSIIQLLLLETTLRSWLWPTPWSYLKQEYQTAWIPLCSASPSLR